jgi:hypothetical protein
MANLLTAEFRRAIPHVKRLLQTTVASMHFSFDGWTFRQNDSFLGINAHFLDKNWIYQTVFLGLLPFMHHHTDNAITDEMASILQEFNVEDKCHGSSLDLTLGHVTIDIRVEGAILVHSEGAILMHSEETTDILGKSHPSFTRPTLG